MLWQCEKVRTMFPNVLAIRPTELSLTAQGIHIEHSMTANSGMTVDVRAIDLIASVFDRISALTNLKPNWAGRGTGPVSLFVAERAQQAFAMVAPDGLPAPAVVPGSD